MTLKDQAKKEKLKKTLSGVIDFNVLLESTLDRSLTNRYIDANQFIAQYNHFRSELFTLQPDEDIEAILPQMPLYVYTGDDQTDVTNVKQLLVETYQKNSQLMAYLQNLLQLD